MKEIALSIFLANLMFCSSSYAVNLGEIEVTSAFGEPLKAIIPVLNVDEADSESIKAMFAENYAFLNARINRKAVLDSIDVVLAEDDSGKIFVSLSSDVAINKLFLELIIDVSWDKGTFSKKFTVLLEPVDYRAQYIKPGAIAPARKLKIIEPVVKVRSHGMDGSAGDSHDMDSSLGEDSHGMDGSAGDSHDMDSSLGEDSHGMDGSAGESHGMDSSLGEDSHGMDGSAGESHGMDSSLGEDSHGMDGSAGESHGMNSSIEKS